MKTNKLDDAEKTYNEAKKYVQQGYQLEQIQRQMMEIYRRKGTLDEYLKEVEKQGMLSLDMQKSIARNYQNSGKFDEAIKAYEKALQMASDDWEMRDIERQMLTILRQHGKLEQHLKEAEKKGTLTFSMKVALAQHYRTKGESEKAIKAYKEAIDMSSNRNDTANVYSELMKEYIRIGKDDLALALYDTMEKNSVGGTAISSGSGGFNIRFGEDNARNTLISAYKSQGKLEHLKTTFESRITKNANDHISLEVIGEIYRNAKNHEKTAETYQALTKADPTNVRAYFYAAAAFNKTGNAEQVKEMINQGNTALTTSQRSQDLWFLSSLGTICYQGELYEPAIKHLKDALVVNTSRHGGGNRWEEEIIYDLIGKSALALKQYEEAVEAYTQLKKIARDSNKKRQAENAIKQAYKEGNLFEKQLPEQIKKVEDNPNDADARLTLAQTYIQNDMFKEAITQYEKLTEIQSDKVEWYKKVGELYLNATDADMEENLKKAANVYEKALTLEPTSYQIINSLANTYKRQKNLTKAEYVYRQALQISLKSTEHDAIVKALLDLYPGAKNAEKRLTLLNELGAKSANSPLLHKMLGDTFLESEELEKATEAYEKWLELIGDDPEQRRNVPDMHLLVYKLISDNKLPEIALKLAERVVEFDSSPVMNATLGSAYLLNEEYDKALEKYSISLNPQGHSHTFRVKNIESILQRISQTSKHIKDKEKYNEMMGKLFEEIPTDFGSQLNANLLIAEFCRKLGMNDKARVYVQRTGFFPERAWLTLGPFDNTAGIGYNTEYISEETTEIDRNTEYEGLSGQVKWQQGTDEVYDGFFSFGEDEKWLTSYAWISFSSPNERQAQIRFDSDDQGKVWLNGKKVYAHRRTRGAQIDRRTIPVTITQGKNTILVKVSNESLPWGFYLRITDTDGNPFGDLELSDPE